MNGCANRVGGERGLAGEIGRGDMIKWLQKLRVAHKLVLVSVVFMIPDSVMLYLFITSIIENIDVARLERAGNEYQRAVEPLLDLIPEHRLLARAAPADRDAGELARVRGRIDAAFDRLAEVDARLGTALDFTPEGLRKRNRDGCDPAGVRRAWDRLRAAADRPPADAVDAAHVRLAGDVRAMIAHAGDTSNLILDPELDSYYLMDATLMALPQAQGRLAQVMADGADRIRAGGPPRPGDATLAVGLARLRRDDVDRVQSSTQTALANGNPAYGPNEGLQRRLPPLVKAYAEAAGRFGDLVERLQSPDAGGVAEADLLAAGRAARRASFDLWAVANEELDGLLQRRVDHYAFRRSRSLGVAAAAALAAAVLVTFITRSISGPLKRQAEDLGRACLEARAERRLAEERLGLQQRAEADLRAAQDRLVAAGRHAGMAEVATGVLHNVGNVLNSVNVSVHLIKDQVRGSQVAKLARTADLIDAHEHDLTGFLTGDAKGKLIPGYVSKLARLLDGENALVMAEVENLARGVEHIKQVVQFQQGYAKPSTHWETVSPADLLEDALRLNLIALDRHGVTIVREVDAVGPVRIDKHKTLQILVNLISNAKNAMRDLNANRERRLTLRLTAVPLDRGARLRIAVRDNGVGIAPGHLSRIFEHGFTTRADGHGFGLHSAANAAREMGGTIEVDSPGPGRGAAFTLDVPVKLAAEVA